MNPYSSFPPMSPQGIFGLGFDPNASFQSSPMQQQNQAPTPAQGLPPSGINPLQPAVPSPQINLPQQKNPNQNQGNMQQIEDPQGQQHGKGLLGLLKMASVI